MFARSKVLATSGDQSRVFRNKADFISASAAPVFIVGKVRPVASSGVRAEPALPVTLIEGINRGGALVAPNAYTATPPVRTD